MKQMHMIAAILAGFLVWSAARSQPGSRGYVSTGLSYQKWNIEKVEDPLQQTSVPVSAYFPFSKRLAVHFSNLPAATQFGETKLKGISDTWIKATYLFPGEKFMINAGVGAPTGKTGLTASEFMLSQLLSENLFRFQLPIYGQGFSAKIGAAVALPLNETWVLGFGVNSVTKQAYQPLDDDRIKFQPGGETSVFVGFDSKLSTKSKWSLDVVYTLYGKDQINSEIVYASGAKMLIHSQLVTALGKGLLTTSLYFRQKGKNEYWTGTMLEPESKNSNGNQLEMDVDWQIIKWQTGALSLLGAGRFFSNNEYDEGEASVLGGGAGMAVRLSAKTSLALAIKYLSGTFKSAKDVNVNGIDAMGGFTFEL